MTGILNLLLAAGGVVKDTYFNLVTLLLPGNGTNGAQNNTFLDSSSNNFPITRNPSTGPNAPTQGTFSPFSQTGWGNYFDGTDDYLSVADNAVLRPGAGAFTLEAWIYRNASGAAHTIYAKGGASTGIVFQVASTNVLRFTHTTTNIDSTGTIASNSWVHVAVVREGTGTNQTKLYINGTQDGQGTVSTDFTQTEEVRIGTNRGATDDFNGYISNLRFVKGTALYTGTFTPSTSPLTTTSQGATASEVELLTCQSNRFLDTSDNAFTITVNGTPSVQAFSPFAPSGAYTTTAVGGSGYFDGSGDFLSVAANAAFNFGAPSGNTNDFTIEMWVYPTRSAFVDFELLYGTGGSGGQDQLNLYANGTAQYYDGTNNVISPALVLNQWNHVAVVRNGASSNNLRVYANGVSGTAVTSTNALGSSVTSPRIGLRTDSFNPYQGYISNVRVVKGTAVYTGAYSPPIAPLTTSGPASSYSSTTNVNTTFTSTNTSLLLNFTNAGITDATAKNDLETVGNAQISTTQSKFGGSSMSFDGTGDYLYQPNQVNLQFGTGDYTIEFWIYPNAFSGTPVIIDFRTTNGSTGGAIQIYMTTSGVLTVVGGSSTATTLITAGSSLSTGAWVHVALTRSGTSTRLFINGTQSGSTATDSTSYGLGTLWIGAIASGASNNLNAYIDDLRITKGYARYVEGTGANAGKMVFNGTNNLALPSSAFPLQ